MASRYTFSRFFRPRGTFDPADDRLDLSLVERLTPVVNALSWWFRPTYHGMDHIPRDGAALLVGNHGIIGFDPFFLFTAMHQQTGRMARGLGDHHLFVDPLSHWFWSSIGGIRGTQENALKFLAAGHLVNVYPGGARDAFKGPEGRYRLHWEHSRGYIRLALRAQVPIILHMGIGTDDTYRILGKWQLPARLLGHPKYALPILMGWGPVPRPVKFDYHISEPIELEGSPDQAEDAALVERLHTRIWAQGQQMLADGLARRKSLWLG